MYYILFIFSLFSEHLECFPFVAIMSNTALKYPCKKKFSFILDIFLEVEFLDCIVTWCSIL